MIDGRVNHVICEILITKSSIKIFSLFNKVRMQNDIYEFLPKYPNIEKSSYDLFNPYEAENFYEAIFTKKEFYDNKLEEVEDFPEERGTLMKHQRLIARFLSSHTPYNSLLLVHEMGLARAVQPQVR